MGKIIYQLEPLGFGVAGGTTHAILVGEGGGGEGEGEGGEGGPFASSLLR